MPGFQSSIGKATTNRMDKISTQRMLIFPGNAVYPDSPVFTNSICLPIVDTIIILNIIITSNASPRPLTHRVK